MAITPWNGRPLSLKVLGTNAGTSMDGLDIVHMHFSQDSPVSPLKMHLLHAGEIRFDGHLKKRVMRLIKENKTSPEEISMVNIQLGEFAANAVIQFAQEQGFSLENEVDLIAGQGQTIWHLPLPEMFRGDQQRAHLDMAEISIIAAKTGITSLSNFRVSDMALGRQGCPLFVAWDGLCATHPTKNRAVQNIGGIANITMLPKGDVQQGYDFDTGPGNVFIDAAVRYFSGGKQQYDKDGKMGASGTVDQTIVDEFLRGPYFVHDIPKTTGRETFGDTMGEDICQRMIAKGAAPEDCVATITRITAKALADAYERWGPKGGIEEIYLGGGGSYNLNIINYLRERMPHTKIAFLDEIGVPTGSREAMSFGFKGLECIVGRSLVVPQRVESSRAGIIGHIQPGSGLSYHRLMKHVQDFWGNYPLERRMDPVLEMEIVRAVTNGTDEAHARLGYEEEYLDLYELRIDRKPREANPVNLRQGRFDAVVVTFACPPLSLSLPLLSATLFFVSIVVTRQAWLLRRSYSRTRISCGGCRKRHLKCDGGQPCQRCWQDGLSCAYNQARLFRAKEWTPQDAGLPSVPTAGLATAKVSKVSFVSENRRVESRYEIVDSARAPGPATKRTKTPGSSSFWENGPSAQHDESKLEDIPLRPPITDPTEAFFMERYCNIIGPWFDMFNTHGHWSHMVPHLALSNKALFRSIVASCAKQYGLVAGESSIFALDYYNLALKELTQALGDDGLTSTAAVFASCLLTGYCEMIDAKSLDWQTHLRGTFSLCSTQGWHGQCGGVAQSCFWVYCRMDLLASLARAERTRLDTSSWLPKDGSLGPSDEQRGWEPDSWCNQIVLLLAQTHNLLCDVRQSSCSPVDQPYLLRRWNAVSMALSNHEAARPPWFRPVIQLPPTGAANPFERITYVSAAACAATQMLDLTSLLLIVAFPDKSPAQQRERLTSYAVTELALSLSRKIAGNSITNRLTIAWANAVQLLSSAGLVLVADNERAAVVKILQDIKKETGWSVEGHVDRLSEWWRASDGHFRGNYWQYKGSPGNDMMLRQIGESLTSIAGKFEAY